MQPAGVDEWAPAVVNRPFSIGDYLYTDRSSVAELHLDNAVMRMGQVTSFGFLNMTDQLVQLKITEGDMSFTLHDLSPNDVFEVDTPNAAITLLRVGTYRIHVDPDANTTFVFTRSGEAEVTGGGQAFTLNPGNSASLSGTDQLTYDIEGPPQPDSFDSWCAQRDAREAQSEARRYLPPTVVGSEDLGDYGTWANESEYGPVWYPQSVPVGWAPYHYGHWAWIEPWGWTWVDDEPWGFAPFHYGRWVYWRDRWGWAPGPCARIGYGGPIIRPVYAPALVAWFGGAHWGVSIGIGAAPSVGWVPLGWGEVYTPSYQCSRSYFNNVNVYNTRIVNTTNITNVYNTVYVNKTVYNQNFVNVRAPNAVNAMPQNAFASGRPVNQAGTFVPHTQLARFQPSQAALVAPPVAPTRQAVAPSLGRPAVTPPPQVIQRPVIARNAPPPAPASFASRQAFLAQHAGQPHNYVAMRQATASQPPRVVAVRQVPPVQPITVHPGEHGGNAPGAVAGHGPAPRSPQGSYPAPGTPPARNGSPAARTTPPTPQGAQPPVQRAQSPGYPNQGVQPQAQQPQARPSHGTPPNLRQGGQQPGSNQPYHSPETSPGHPNTNGQPTRQAYPDQRQAYPDQRQAQPETNRPAPQYSRPAEQPRPAPQPPREAGRPVEQSRPPSQPSREVTRPTEEPRPAPQPPREVTRPAEQPRPAPQPPREVTRPAEQPRPAQPPPREVTRPSEQSRPAQQPREEHGNPPNRGQKEESRSDHGQR